MYINLIVENLNDSIQNLNLNWTKIVFEEFESTCSVSSPKLYASITYTCVRIYLRVRKLKFYVTENIINLINPEYNIIKKLCSTRHVTEILRSEYPIKLKCATFLRDRTSSRYTPTHVSYFTEWEGGGWHEREKKC